MNRLKIREKKGIMQKIQNISRINNILDPSAFEIEKFIQSVRHKMDSTDRTRCGDMGRPMWSVRGETFKAKTSNDMTAFATAWFNLLLHYNTTQFEDLPDKTKTDFIHLLFNIRAKSLQNMQSIAKLMLQYCGSYCKL